MRSIVTFEGIDEALENLRYNKKALKYKLINAIREHYRNMDEVAAVKEIDTDFLVKSLWDTGDDPAIIRNRRKNLNSIKSTVNADLKRLYEEGKNSEGIVINQKNTFDMSDEAKSEMLESFSYGEGGDGQMPLSKIADVLNIINDFISNKDASLEDDEKYRQLKEIIKEISAKVGVTIDTAGSANEGQLKYSGGEDGTETVSKGDESSNEIHIVHGADEEDGPAAEGGHGERKAEKKQKDEMPEIVNDTGDLPEEELEDEPGAELSENLEGDVFEEIDGEEVSDDEIEEIIEEIDADELDDADIEEIDEIPEEELEEVPEDEIEEELAEDLEDDVIEEVEVEDHTVDELDMLPEEELEELPEDEIIEELAADLDDDFEEVEVEDVADDEIDELPEEEDSEEIEEAPEEEFEDVDEDEIEDELIDELGDDDLEEVEVEDIVDDEPGEIEGEENADEFDEAVEEPDDIPEEEIEEELVDGLDDDDIEEVEIVDAPDDEEDNVQEVGEEKDGEYDYTLEELLDGYDASGYLSDEDQHRALLLADEFDKMLSESERYYNRYLLIPGGRYITGHADPVSNEKKQQDIQLSEFYFGKFPVTNHLFELFIEKTGYVTTAERTGYGIVYRGRYRNLIDKDTGRKTLEWNSSLESEKVKGACWFMPNGPGSSLHGKRNHPVVQVSFEDAIAFAAWTGKRLPKEEEWEAASRTSTGLDYPWGKKLKEGSCNIESTAIGDTTPVDEFEEAANSFGVCDLIGNVLEWTGSSDLQSGNRRFISKGGSWVSGDNIRITQRFLLEPKSCSNILGFRCIACK